MTIDADLHGAVRGFMREAGLNWAAAILSFLASLISFLALCGGGAALLLVANSGEQATGAMLAFCGAVAFAAVMALLFAPEERFREPTWRAGAVAAAIIGAIPVGGLAAAAFRFTGLPLRSAMPLVDWPIFLLGIFLAVGAVSILALGYRRARTTSAPLAMPGEIDDMPELEAGVIHMQQIRAAQAQLRSALEQAAALSHETRDLSLGEDGKAFRDDIRVRRV
jgi:MFS family permease